MMIIEYALPSLTLNDPCKEYQIIYESVHSYLCTCMRNKYTHARVNLLVLGAPGNTSNCDHRLSLHGISLRIGSVNQKLQKPKS